jgi:hypothetical protein
MPDIDTEIIFLFEENKVEMKMGGIRDNRFNVISELAQKLKNSINNDNLLAFGVNIFSTSSTSTELDFRESLIGTYLKDKLELEKLMEVEMFSFAPQFNFMKDNYQFQASLKPDRTKGDKMANHINIHVEKKDDEQFNLFGKEELKDLLTLANSQLDHLISTVIKS